MNKANIVLGVGVVVALILGVIGVVRTPSQTQKVIERIVGASPGPRIDYPVIELAGHIWQSEVASTTYYSASKATMTSGDLAKYGVFNMTVDNTLDLTLPATSTFQFPRGIDRFTILINNDGDSPIALKAGTGIDLESNLASTTLGAFVEADDSAFVTFQKAATTTDWKAFIEPYGDAD